MAGCGSRRLLFELKPRERWRIPPSREDVCAHVLDPLGHGSRWRHTTTGAFRGPSAQFRVAGKTGEGYSASFSRHQPELARESGGGRMMVGPRLRASAPWEEHVMGDKMATESRDGMGERPKPITFLETELTVTDRFAVVRRDRVRFGGNVEGTHWRITSGNGYPGVVILPLRDGHVGLVESTGTPSASGCGNFPAAAPCRRTRAPTRPARWRRRPEPTMSSCTTWARRTRTLASRTPWWRSSSPGSLLGARSGSGRRSTPSSGCRWPQGHGARRRDHRPVHDHGVGACRVAQAARLSIGSPDA